MVYEIDMTGVDEGVQRNIFGHQEVVSVAQEWVGNQSHAPRTKRESAADAHAFLKKAQ